MFIRDSGTFYQLLHERSLWYLHIISYRETKDDPYNNSKNIKTQAYLALYDRESFLPSTAIIRRKQTNQRQKKTKVVLGKGHVYVIRTKAGHLGCLRQLGQTLCQIFEKYLLWKGLWCPCCGYRFRGKPRSPNYKDRFRARISQLGSRVIYTKLQLWIIFY